MSYGFAPYVSVAEKKEKIRRSLIKLRKKDPSIAPVEIIGSKIAKTWWGIAWNQNMESYADFYNRIDRGRNYVRQGALLDLKISEGRINALVQGSRAKPYEVEIVIAPLPKAKWKKVNALCNHQIESLEELIEGKFPKELEVIFKDKDYGLFPSPKEIRFNCSCPDGAYVCKHIAATLYGIGARLDENPLLFFELRNIDSKSLIQKSMDDKLHTMLKNAGKKSKREIDEKDITDIFGI
ncbi:MAG: SWIM zinc finger family protein [Erysipelotrichaceae bacterium]